MLSLKQIAVISDKFGTMIHWEHLNTEILPRGYTLEVVRCRDQEVCFLFTPDGFYCGECSPKSRDALAEYLRRSIHPPGE